MLPSSVLDYVSPAPGRRAVKKVVVAPTAAAVAVAVAAPAASPGAAAVTTAAAAAVATMAVNRVEQSHVGHSIFNEQTHKRHMLIMGQKGVEDIGPGIIPFNHDRKNAGGFVFADRGLERAVGVELGELAPPVVGSAAGPFD